MAATQQKVLYTAKRATSGLTDVKIDIYNSTNTKVVNQGVMTEIGSTGMYYYEYTPVSAGWHIWTADSATQPSMSESSFLSDYTTDSTASTSESTYGTTQELARYMNIEGLVPSIEASGTARARENLGTGDNSNTLFYTDNSKVLADTYTFSYGSSESSLTTLTETTHYTFSVNDGTMTLTSAGVTAVGTANIYGSYSYCSIGLTDTQLQEALTRAESEIDQRTYTHFSDGTVATPDYTAVTKEKKTGKGDVNLSYFLDHYPVVELEAAVTGTAVAKGDSTIYVDSTNGFPSTGTIVIESDDIVYTGKTSTTFTGCYSTGTATVDTAHAVAETVTPHIVRTSTTQRGLTPTFTTLEKDRDYDIDYKSGRVHLYESSLDVSQNTMFVRFPAYQVPNRLQVSYIHGWNTIPSDIKRCTLMIASKDLMHTTVRKSHTYGINEFNLELVDVDENWINRTIAKYKSVRSTNI